VWHPTWKDGTDYRGDEQNRKQEYHCRIVQMQPHYKKKKERLKTIEVMNGRKNIAA